MATNRQEHKDYKVLQENMMCCYAIMITNCIWR